ncbi:hypothetical protein ACFLVF_02355 [Chloroflexota bacterium]
MEGLNSLHTHLKNLHHQARRLTSTGLSLITLFAQEANRLSREDEASRLKALHSYIRQRLKLVRRSEEAASQGHTKANLIASLGGLALGGIVKRISNNKRVSSFADYLFEMPISEERPFGMVLVCIGPKGLPNGVEVVCISKLARESNRSESEVIKETQEPGYLLFDEKVFSLLIDRLVDDVRDGRLRLPISRETLSQVMMSSKLSR